MNSPGAYLYLLHGEDAFARDEALQTLRERMRALPAGEHNLTELRDEQATVAALRLAADSIPFLAERRMVVVHGLVSRLQKGGPAKRRGKAASSEGAADEYEALLAYLPGVPATTSVAFVEPGAVQADRIMSAMPRGRGFERVFPRVRFEDVPGWIRQRARAVKADVDESAVRELARLGGEDLRRLDNEIRKLADYANGATVTRVEVQKLVAARDASTWALLDALTDRRREAALMALRQLYSQGEPPEAILSRDVAPLYRRLLIAKEVSRLPRDERARFEAGSVGLNPRTLPRLVEQAARFDAEELERALELLLDLDRQIKTGETEPETAVEVAIVQLTSRLSAGAA